MLKHDHQLSASLCRRKATEFEDDAAGLFAQAEALAMDGQKDKARWKRRKATRMYNRSIELGVSATKHARKAA